MKPHHEHDCDLCVYLGTTSSRNGVDGLVDIYVCPEMGYGTTIFRYGSEGDYSSGDYMIYKPPWSNMLTEDQFIKARCLMRHWRKHWQRRERMKLRRTTRRRNARELKRSLDEWESSFE